MTDDFDWEQLLEGIRHGSVIPVVGRDLLQVEFAGRRTTVSSYLAEELAIDLGVDPQKLPASPDFADVFSSEPSLCARLMKNARTIYSKVAHVYESSLRLNRNFPVPAALEKLAEIQSFTLFVSLTCDDLLHRALEAARRITPVSIDNERRGVPDVTDEQLKSVRPIIYRMFGKFAHYGDYALTDEDMLEFMHWLPDRAYRPEKLFDHIQCHDLLLLGTALPDWMACFFLRATRRLRLSKPSDFTQYIVDYQISKNVRLSAFLQNFGTAVTIFAEGDPVAFVDELHSRCKAAGIASKETLLPATDVGIRPPEVFLSYARENRDAAFTVKAMLEERGLSVWVDKAKGTYHRLSSGAEYEQQIRDRIHQSTAFVPLLSRVMTSFEDRFFRKEWRLAAERLPDLFGTGRSFIIPVLIDDTPLTELRIPKEFRDREIKHAPNGRLTEEISADIIQEIDLLRLQRSRPK